MSTTLDTLQIFKDLQAASFSEPQAEALARLLRERQQADLSQLATKQDLALLEQRIVIKLGVMLVAAVAVMATLAQLLR